MKISFRGLRKIALTAAALVLVGFVAFAGNEQGASAQGQISSVGLGGDHTCFLTTQKQVKCAGDNHYGQLGNGDSSVTGSDKPVLVQGLNGVEKIFAGAYDSCALKFNGKLWCWGDNPFGQLTDGTKTSDFTPVEYKGLTSGVRDVAIGFGDICVAEDSGALVCSGANYVGQLATGSVDEPDTCGEPPNTYGCTLHAYQISGIPGDIIDVATAKWTTCALSGGGEVDCWGANHAGALGQGSPQGPSQCQYASFPCSLVPVKVNGLPADGTEIVAGDAFFCELSGGAVPQDASGPAGGQGTKVKTNCWGDDLSNQFGHPPTNQNCFCDPSPGFLTGAPDVVTQIAAGSGHICMLSPQAGAECLGTNFFGQLARGTHTVTATLAPVTVSNTELVHCTTCPFDPEIAASGQDTCAVLTSGVIKCAGDDSDGQLGFAVAAGDCTCQTTLFPVPGLNDNALPHIFDQPGQIYYPTVVTQKNGEIGMTWLNVAPDHTNDILFSHSTDNGATWSDPVPVVSEPATITGVTSAYISGITYISFVDHGAGEGRVKLTSSTDNVDWTTTVILGLVHGDGAPQIVAGDSTCPTPGPLSIVVAWSDYASIASGSGNAYMSQFKVGDPPVDIPVDFGAVDSQPAVTEEDHDVFAAMPRHDHVSVMRNGQEIAKIPTEHIPHDVSFSRISGDVNDLVVIWYEEGGGYFASVYTRGLGCEQGSFGPRKNFSEIPLGQIRADFAAGPGEITYLGEEGLTGAVPQASSQGIWVASWVEACCHGKFHLLNTVSTDGGATWSPAKEVAPPNDFVYGQSVAILGTTIWNVFTSSTSVSPGVLQDNIEVAASVDGGATYKSFNITSDNVSSAPVPFFLSASADAYVQSAAALNAPPSAGAPIILTWQHKDQAGDKQLAVEPLSLAGDSSCDNVINVKDLLAILRDIAEAGAAPCQSGADTNCDGGVGVDDAFRELRWIGDVPEDPPAGCIPIGY